MMPSLELETYRGSWPVDDPHANFKAEVALYSIPDPMPTLVGLSEATSIPIGSLARYVLVRWCASCADTLLALGPIALQQIQEHINRAEAAGDDQSRLSAYHALRQMIGWLSAGATDPGEPTSCQGENAPPGHGDGSLQGCA